MVVIRNQTLAELIASDFNQMWGSVGVPTDYDDRLVFWIGGDFRVIGGGGTGSILSGDTAPASELGEDGDLYIRTDESDPETTLVTIYGPKTAGAWGTGVLLNGPAGAAGAPGAPGAAGAQGPAGATGPPGTTLFTGLTDGPGTIAANQKVVGNGGGTALVLKLDTLHGLLDVQSAAPSAGQGLVYDLEALGAGLQGFKYDTFLKLTLSGSPYTTRKTLIANGSSYVDVLVALLPLGLATGDIWYWDHTSGTGTRLPIGANGSILNVVSGLPAYTPAATIIAAAGGAFEYVPLAEQASNVASVANGSLVPVNSTGGTITVAPPPSTTRARFAVVDSRGTADTNAITVTFGAALFHGVNQNYVMNTENASAQFLYLGAPIGWVKL